MGQADRSRPTPPPGLLGIAAALLVLLTALGGLAGGRWRRTTLSCFPITPPR